MATLAPRPTLVPALGPDDCYTETQWKVLFALMDAIVPSIVVADNPAAANADPEKARHMHISEAEFQDILVATRQTMQTTLQPDRFREYLAKKTSENPEFVERLKRVVLGMPPSGRQKLGGMLNFLGTRVGALVGTGYLTPVHEQPAATREAIIRSWWSAWVPLWPTLAKAFSTLARIAFAQAEPLLIELSDYRLFDDEYKPGPAAEHPFMQFDAGSEPATIETDVVIVGSGCGGGVTAKVLAEAGHKVVVVDKGFYFPPEQLPMVPEPALKFLYEGEGAVQSANASIAVLAGACWGGGGTINWSACLRTQDFVLREWSQDKGITFFETQAYQECLDRVCEFMGVSDAHIRQNHGNRVLLEGGAKLGLQTKAVPQNTGGAEHYCGNCTLGCGSGEKQGPAVSWLPAAAKTGNAQFIEGFNASKILFEEDDGKKKAVGIEGQWISRDKDGSMHLPPSERVQRTVQIKARRVIVSAGTLHSPLILQRSGLKNPHIGQNLHLHPAGNLNAAFPEDIKGWEGGTLTSVVSSYENLDGKGHGVKLECSAVIPHMTLFQLPWFSGLQWKTDALKLRHMNNFISITRDRDTGRVYADPDDGRVVIDYTPSEFDRAHTLAGLIAIARICYLQGATEIFPLLPNMKPFRAPPTSSAPRSANDPALVAWLADLERTGIQSPFALLSSAHQMGTCRMSAAEADGVVDPSGKVWEVDEGLYVADASVFPSASGVNPMVTNMAIADHIARGVAAGLAADDGEKQGAAGRARRGDGGRSRL